LGNSPEIESVERWIRANQNDLKKIYANRIINHCQSEQK